MISVCQGDDIPRKGGPAITRSDLLVVNKTDLAPYVGADLSRMERDAAKGRASRPTVFTDLSKAEGLGAVVEFLVATGGLSALDAAA